MTAMPPTPRCPRCDQPPRFLMGGGTQAFCGTDDCAVMTWNPQVTAAEFEATAAPTQLTRED